MKVKGKKAVIGENEDMYITVVGDTTSHLLECLKVIRQSTYNVREDVEQLDILHGADESIKWYNNFKEKKLGCFF